MRNCLKIVFIIFKSLLIFILIGAISTACVKNVQKMIIVEEFKSKGIYQEDMSISNIKYYKIESNEEIPAYTVYNDEILPGYEGDILVSTQAVLNPLVNGFVSFFAGGHAAICTGDYRDQDIDLDDYSSIEATGLYGGSNPALVLDRDYWSGNTYNEVIALRVKMTMEQRKEIISLASSIIGDSYNFSFLFDTVNKSYCSDLVSKCFSYVGADLNKDDFTTSIYDLIISKDSYISYYHYIDSDGVKHIYYLG